MLAPPTPDPLTPDAATCERLLAEAGDGPVIVVQLIRFKPDGGEERFDGYGRISHPLMERARGEILYLGNAGLSLAGKERWDLAAVVRFPSAERLHGMLTDPSFQGEGRRMREDCIERVEWLVTYPV